jgi:hypothetical protein
MSGLATNDPLDAADDKDGDGLNNLLEAQIGSSLTNTDSDGDTLSDYDEYMIYKTNATLADSDNDGINDDIEIAAGRNPNVNEAVLITIITGLLLN